MKKLMRKYIVFILLVAMSVTVSAQTQHSYVKTKGREGYNKTVIAGTRIPGATIQVRARMEVRKNENN